VAVGAGAGAAAVGLTVSVLVTVDGADVGVLGEHPIAASARIVPRIEPRTHTRRRLQNAFLGGGNEYPGDAYSGS